MHRACRSVELFMSQVAETALADNEVQTLSCWQHSNPGPALCIKKSPSDSCDDLLRAGGRQGCLLILPSQAMWLVPQGVVIGSQSGLSWQWTGLSDQMCVRTQPCVQLCGEEWGTALECNALQGIEAAAPREQSASRVCCTSFLMVLVPAGITATFILRRLHCHTPSCQSSESRTCHKPAVGPAPPSLQWRSWIREEQLLEASRNWAAMSM